MTCFMPACGLEGRWCPDCAPKKVVCRDGVVGCTVDHPNKDNTHQKEPDVIESDFRPICLLFAPWRTRTDAEDLLITRAIKHLTDCGWVPLFLPLVLQRALDDNIPLERQRALACSEAFVHHLTMSGACFTAFRLPGRITPGMKMDIEIFNRAPFVEHVRVLTYTERDQPRTRPEIVGG